MAKSFLHAFVIGSLTFYSSMRQSYDTGCASSLDAQFHLTLLYNNNSPSFQYAKEVEDYENHHGGIVLDPSKEESFGLYFSTLQPHTISPAYLDIYHKKALLIVRMLELRLGTTLLLQVRVM